MSQNSNQTMSVAIWLDQVLGAAKNNTPAAQASAYAPSNIALSKYWGKREEALICQLRAPYPSH